MLDIIDEFLEKKSTFGVLGKGSWAFVIPFGFKITLDYRSKKSENVQGGREGESLACVTLFGFKITIDYRSKKSKGGRVLSICGSLWDQNHNWLSAKKLEKMPRGRGSWAFVTPFGLKILKKIEKMLDIVGAFWEKNRLSREGGRGGGLEHLRGEGVLSICGTFWYHNHDWLSVRGF